MVVPSIHREWNDCQFRAYSQRLIGTFAKRYADAAITPLAETCLANVDMARSAFDSIEKPSIYLSRRWRIVATEDLFGVELPSLRGVMAKVIDREPYPEWLPACQAADVLVANHDAIEHSAHTALQAALRDRRRHACVQGNGCPFL